MTNFDKAHTEKVNCPNCNSQKTITLKFDNIDGGTGEQPFRLTACSNCGKKPTIKQLRKIITLPITKNN